MIKYPTYWNLIGRKYNETIFAKTLKDVLNDIPCNNLSYSGGIDSSLLLYFMLELGRKVKTFTIACNENHPDIDYSILGLRYFRDRFNVKVDSEHIVLNNAGTGDSLVSAFYKNLAIRKVTSIITGDGIDEFTCGYYKHQENVKEQQYYDILQRLQAEQLEPLNTNSHKVEVYIPYLDSRMLALYAGIPIAEKVDSQHRKKIILSLATDKVPKEIIERKKYGFCTVP